MRFRPIVVLLLPLALCTAGCGPAFDTATGAFAKATSATTEAMRPLMVMHDQQCRREASYDWLFKNLSTSPTPGAPWVWPGVATLARPTVPIIDLHANELKHIPVDDYCQRLGVADVVVAKALDTLDGYAAALSAVASGTSIDTDALSTTVTDAAAMMALIANDQSKSKPVTDAVSALRTPMSSLVKQIVGAVKARQLKRTIRDVDRDLGTVIAALHQYVSVNRDLATATSVTMGQAMDKAEQHLKGQPISLYDALVFRDRVNAEKALSGDALAALGQFDALLSSLSGAQAKLLAAANGTLPEKEALKQALAYAKEILTHVATLKSITQGKG